VTRSWYLDSSVLLTLIYRQPGALDPDSLAPAFTSVLTRVECLRSLDRRRLQGRISGQEMVEGREYVYRLFRAVRVLDLEDSIFERAAGPISVPLKTLDAIHLATALQWREDIGEEVTFATHDRGLAAAARAYGLVVVGA
jgi:uncharacterized protein